MRWWRTRKLRHALAKLAEAREVARWRANPEKDDDVRRWRGRVAFYESLLSEVPRARALPKEGSR